MKELSVNTLKTELGNWIKICHERLSGLTQPFFMEGGWEGWIQVELALFLAAKRYNVTREKRVYGTKQRADLIINESLAGKPIIIAEIKCEAIHFKTDQFLKALDEDAQKMQTLKGAGMNGVILAFVIDGATQEHLLKSGYENPYPTAGHFFTLLIKSLF